LRLEIEASLVDVLTTAAEWLLRLGDAVTAVRIAEWASSLRPDREDVRSSLMRAYAQAGRHQAAAEAESQ
jgi:DNA-binding SARP family transcriptional activator